MWKEGGIGGCGRREDICVCGRRDRCVSEEGGIGCVEGKGIGVCGRRVCVRKGRLFHTFLPTFPTSLSKLFEPTLG